MSNVINMNVDVMNLSVQELEQYLVKRLGQKRADALMGDRIGAGACLPPNWTADISRLIATVYSPNQENPGAPNFTMTAADLRADPIRWKARIVAKAWELHERAVVSKIESKKVPDQTLRVVAQLDIEKTPAYEKMEELMDAAQRYRAAKGEIELLRALLKKAAADRDELVPFRQACTNATNAMVKLSKENRELRELVDTIAGMLGHSVAFVAEAVKAKIAECSEAKAAAMRVSESFQILALERDELKRNWENRHKEAAAGAVVDRNVELVRKRLAQRAAFGLAKYGMTTERIDLKTAEWLQHLQDELLDASVYVERLKGDALAIDRVTRVTDERDAAVFRLNRLIGHYADLRERAGDGGLQSTIEWCREGDAKYHRGADGHLVCEPTCECRRAHKAKGEKKDFEGGKPRLEAGNEGGGGAAG